MITIRLGLKMPWNLRESIGGNGGVSIAKHQS